MVSANAKLKKLFTSNYNTLCFLKTNLDELHTIEPGTNTTPIHTRHLNDGLLLVVYRSFLSNTGADPHREAVDGGGVGVGGCRIDTS